MNKAVILLVFLLIPFAFAEIISENGITIESDKDTYYCQPIFNAQGQCLISAIFYVKYENENPELTIKTTYTTDIKETTFYEKATYNEKTDGDLLKLTGEKVPLTTALADLGKAIPITDTQIRTTEKSTTEALPVKPSDVKIMKIEFYADKNGKFNLEINDGKIITTLDPYYSIDYTFDNASHLIRGYTTRSKDSEFITTTNITAGISDNLSSTQYEIYDTKPLAFDDFESGGITGGSGWYYNWTRNSASSCPVVTTGTPLGTYHLLGYNAFGTNCDIYRTLNLSGYTDINLTFYSKANSLAFGETCTYQYYNGTAYTTLFTYGGGNSTNTYAFYSFNVTSLGLSANSRIRMVVSVSDTTDYCYLDNVSFINNKGNAIKLRWNNVYVAPYDWFLMIYKTPLTTTDLTTYAYNDSDNVSATKVTQTLNGQGWFFVNVTSLMNFEYNTLGLNFTKFRLTTKTTENISDVFLRKSINDTIVPTISNCTINDTSIANGETAQIRCRVTDNLGVANATTKLDGTTYPMMNDFGNYTYNAVCTLSMNGTKAFTLVNATDILGNWNSTNPNVNFTCAFTIFSLNQTNASALFTNGTIVVQTDLPTNCSLTYWYNPTFYMYDTNFSLIHTFVLENLTQNQTYYYNITLCDIYGNCKNYTNFTFYTLTSCVWQVQYTSCQINDTYMKYYIETSGCNATFGLPVDNGTFESCNYCSESLEKDYLNGCYLLNDTGVRDIEYHDNNFYSCCAITSLPSDCSIYFYPYNTTTAENCTLLTEDFAVEYDENCDFGMGFDKCYWNIDLNRTNQSFKCISFVKTATGKLLQSNPVYTKKSDAIIQLKGTDYEDREYFNIQNGIGSVYFTKENLVFDGRNYIFGVQCANDAESLSTEKLVIVGYEAVNAPTTRFIWGIGNLTGLTLTLILSILALIILAALIWMFKRRT